MATTLPVALGLLNRKSQEHHMCAHTHTYKHTQPLKSNTDGVQPVCQSQFSLHEGLVLKHYGGEKQKVANIAEL